MTKILPVILAVVGLIGGAAVGMAMKPAPEPTPEEIEALEKAKQAEAERREVSVEAEADSEYLELSRKLIVPITSKTGRRSFVALDLHLELAPGETERATMHEPKLRDAFLRTLIAFGSTGAFDEHAHTNETLRELGRELLLVAREVLGEPAVRNVLIGDLIKQDA